jgi:acetyl esterase/lipase
VTRHLLLIAATAMLGHAQVSGPDIRVYKTVTAHLFRLAGSDSVTTHPPIVLFHGGGWSAGSPEWVYDAAKDTPRMAP